jgi:hypothetical protein
MIILNFKMVHGVASSLIELLKVMDGYKLCRCACCSRLNEGVLKQILTFLQRVGTPGVPIFVGALATGAEVLLPLLFLQTK